MASNESKKIALALIDDAEEKINQLLGTLIALPLSADNSPTFALDNELIKQIERAIKDLTDDPINLGRANYLLGRLYAVRITMTGTRDMTKAAEYYSKAIDLGYNKPWVLYCMGMQDKVFDFKDDAIKTFQEVISLVGADSELGEIAAREIERTKATKSDGGICFIATAVYDSPQAPEIESLRQFRDDILLQSKAGRSFVALYYRISPPLANIISKSRALKKVVRNYLLEPIIKLIEKR